MVWQESEAAERFDEFFDAAVQEGPQTVSQRGVEVAVLVSFQEWNALNTNSQNLDLEINSREKH
jgi:prevent-host-death family protein